MIKALLFDLDGTLADTDRLHFETFARLLAPLGHRLTYETYAANILGRPNAQIMNRYFRDLSTAEHDRIAFEKEAEYRAMLPESGLHPMTGLMELLDWADERGLAKAVVTNAPRLSAEAVLPALGLAGRFDTVVVGEECSAAKPDPAPYQAAMRTLNVTPAEAIAFEDAPSGIRAARRSGAFVFGLRTSLDDRSLRQAGAHATLSDFTDPSLWSYLDSAMKEPA